MATSTASRPGARSIARGGIGRLRPRTVAIAITIVALLGFGGYTGYAVVVGSDQLLHPGKMTDCRTPSAAYGWSYEVINYDLATDRALLPVEPAAAGRNWT